MATYDFETIKNLLQMNIKKWMGSRFAEEYAIEIGDNQRPFSVPIWEKAYAL